MSGHAPDLARWFLKNSGKDITIRQSHVDGGKHSGLMELTCGDEVISLWAGQLDECFYDMLVGAMFRK